MRYALTVNGERREIDVAPSLPLLWALRDDLELTGTRYGCGRGQCGACYVLADGHAVASCLMTVEQAAQAEITTIEGIADGEQLHPVQQSFIDEDAMQCGYCTSGMIISAVALLSRDASPDDGTVRDAMSAHLCRCGVQGRAIRAIQKAAAT